MSHVTTIDVEIRDLDALDAACRRVGLELVRDQKQYKWFGESVGDTPLPAYFKEEDLGHCDHAVRVPGNAEAYEIGVVRARDGSPGYTLMLDEWGGGFGLVEHCGEGCGSLKQAYATEVTIAAARQDGFEVTEQAMPDGTVRLTCNHY